MKAKAITAVLLVAMAPWAAVLGAHYLPEWCDFAVFCTAVIMATGGVMLAAWVGTNIDGQN